MTKYQDIARRGMEAIEAIVQEAEKDCYKVLTDPQLNTSHHVGITLTVEEIRLLARWAKACGRKPMVSKTEGDKHVGSSDVLCGPTRNKKTASEHLEDWRARAKEYRTQQESARAQGNELHRWYEGKADELERCADVLEYGILRPHNGGAEARRD